MKFKTIIITILVLSFLTFCSKNEDIIIEPVEVVNEMNVTLDGKNYKLINNQIGGNENCDNLYVSTYYFEKNKVDFRLNISISTLGQLSSVNYGEYKLPNTSVQVLQTYLTPNFYPTKTFSITDFSYNTVTRDLKFKFSGTVFSEYDNSISKFIKGDINIKSFKTIDCSVAKTGLTYNSNNFYLQSFHNYRTKYSNNTHEYRYLSNNGYYLDIIVDQDLWNIPLGEINFNENSIQNKVILKKQLGQIIANQWSNINEHPWLNYNTRGKIIIESKIIEKGYKKIIGKINLEILQNNVLIQTLNGIEFSATSFEN